VTRCFVTCCNNANQVAECGGAGIIKVVPTNKATAAGVTGPISLAEVSWERMIQAVEKVKERLGRASAALEKAGLAYAVVGGNAVAAWVSRVDETAVRNTQDVDLLIRREDLDRAITALSAEGFIYRHTAGLDLFLDGKTGRPRDAVHLVFASEKVRPDYEMPAPDVMEAEATSSFRLINLDALVRMKLTSFRDKDRTHLRDLIDVGLLDQSWYSKLPTKLATRLQELLDNPEG
jgi:hypothetical protein